ncbi:2TM domain-containing protein [Methanococcoides vulcani]|uniref:2TM domain-containing protein n=1 Tax=Methanococcoides vulcani TaxID=1353158 RepID=A0A1H9ZTZ5_9EURY|nr:MULTISPECIES: 2TM domain-containing protein [Methanococcoides]SES85220.1 2TM domain-containing protein [Methanococcoides vulcani]
MEERDDKLLRAQERVKELKKFYNHLAVYLVIMVVLFFIDYSDGGSWWVHWPIIGWGIFVVLQGISVSKFGKGWEDKKIKEIMEKEEKE